MLFRAPSAAAFGPVIDGACPCCGAPMRDEWARGDLVIKANPSEAFWRWKTITTSPTRCRLLRLLAQFGAVNKLALVLALKGETSTDAALKVQIHHLRRELKLAGAQVSIKSHWGEGYCLEWSESA